MTEDTWYTDQFSGTSSASPVVVGSIACVQGALKAAGLSLLTPPAARRLLQSSGSAQNDGPAGPSSQRIGNRPDIKQMIGLTLGSAAPNAPLLRTTPQAVSMATNHTESKIVERTSDGMSIVVNIYAGRQESEDR